MCLLWTLKMSYKSQCSGQQMKPVKRAASARMPINNNTPTVSPHHHVHSCTHAY